MKLTVTIDLSKLAPVLHLVARAGRRAWLAVSSYGMSPHKADAHVVLRYALRRADLERR